MDHHLIYDLLPGLARAYFGAALPASLSYGQAAILALLGLQQREVEAATKELGLPTNQVLALFNKVPVLATLSSRPSAMTLLSTTCPLKASILHGGHPLPPRRRLQQTESRACAADAGRQKRQVGGN